MRISSVVAALLAASLAPACSCTRTPPAFSSTPVVDATQGEPYRYEIVVAVVDGAEVTIKAELLPAWLTLTDNLDGTATLAGTPAQQDVGGSSVALVADDGAGGIAAQAFVIAVADANDAPSAVAETLTTDEDNALPLTLRGADEDGGALTFAVVDAPQNGTLTGTPPSLLYTPNENFNGSDSFTFTAADTTETSAPATITIEVAPVNDAPVAQAAAASTDEDTAVEIALAATDADGDAITFGVESAPQNGAVTIDGATATYTPNANFSGADSFVFVASDGVAQSTATVTISVGAVEDAPVAIDQAVTTNEDQRVTVTLTATDDDGDALTFEIVDAPEHGVAVLDGDEVEYLPDADYNGADSFTFRALDADGTASAPATVALTIVPRNDLPQSQAASLVVDEDSFGDIELPAFDVDGDPLTFAVGGAGAQHGIVAVTGNVARYTPEPDFFGEDSFQFRAADAVGVSNTSTVSVTVRGVPDPATANDDTLATAQEVPLLVPLATLLQNDVDPDGDAVIASVFNGVGVRVRIVGDDVEIVPRTGFSGEGGFDYTLAAGGGAFDVAHVVVNVAPAVCGDGFHQSTEECDDGNDFIGDGCTDQCALEVCGDGIVSAFGPSALVFSWLNDSCDGPLDTVIELNGVEIARVTSDAPCACDAPIESVTVTGAALANLVDGDNDVRIRYGTGAGLAPFAWALLQIESAAGSQQVVLFDAGPPGDAEAQNPDAKCLGDFDNGVDATVTVAIANVSESCDDANQDDSDGCTTECLITGCGDGVLDTGRAGIPDEECDDGNNVDGDGCSRDCVSLACGDGDVDPGEECDDGNVDGGDGCSDACGIERCGNGRVDLVDATTLEQCDDGNDVDGDGCSAACLREGCGDGDLDQAGGGGGEIAESEPNDDGARATGGGPFGNDFSAANADGPITANATLSGALSVAGDEDWFRITNPLSSAITVTAQSFIGALGQCPQGSGDTVLAARSANGAELTFNDDISFPENACSLLTLQLGANESAFIGVLSFADNGVIASYFVSVDLGLQFANEECDDGNLVDGDGCSSTCDLEECGDGDIDFVDATTVEECDDGNLADGDGCSSGCLVEFCGDGAQQAALGEECDDGNDVADDGCDPNCTLPACANGVLNAGEECDDGNDQPGDGCGATCLIERCGDGIVNGAITDGAELEPNDDGTRDIGGDPFGNDFDPTRVNGALAGDVTFSGELTPAGDEDWVAYTNPTDDFIVVVAETFIGAPGACFGGDTILSVRDALGEPTTFDDDGGVGFCSLVSIPLGPRETVFIGVLSFGDNVVLGPYFLALTAGFTVSEQCDDGANGDDLDGCDDQCRTVVCGDGDIDPQLAEECDDGNDVDGDGCTSACVIEFCGDAIVNNGEECDGAAGCDSNCTLARCGNGVVGVDENGAAEECDDGNSELGDGCTPDCTLECGDGVIQTASTTPDELLFVWLADSCGDDAAIEVSVGGFVAEALADPVPCECALDLGFLPVNDPIALAAFLDGVADVRVRVVGGASGLAWAAVVPSFGGVFGEPIALFDAGAPGDVFNPDAACNGDVELGVDVTTAVDIGTSVAEVEQCDDGNLVDGDGCDSNCTFSGCGNGVVTAGEECDDGNLLGGDGCSDFCEVEICGNGVVEGGEQCDDGNLDDGDGCDSNCKLTRCGNGIVTAGEECDDGNLLGGDGCSPSCRITVCGNGVVEDGEGCDDGNTDTGDGCSDLCQVEGACEHNICTVGSALDLSCDPCAAEICANDAFCCTSNWDQQCIAEVSSVCGLDICGGPPPPPPPPGEGEGEGEGEPPPPPIP